MPTATLILNPAARSANRLRAQMPAITALLAAHGHTTQLLETSPDPAATISLTHAALETSALILACGGDGTVHTILQAMADPSQPSRAALGVIPLGTANALARNLNLPLDPLAAVAKLLTYTARTIPVGEVESATTRRFFLAMAGCGPDGALAHLLAARTRTKALFGRSAYYAHAARIFFTRRWAAFHVEYRVAGHTTWNSTHAISLMASRVPDLGGLFAGLTPRATLTDPHLHVQLLRPPGHLSLPAWFVCARTGLTNPWLQSLNIDELRCTPLTPTPVYLQADAEPLGPLPFTLRCIPNALSLLMPPKA